MNKEVPKSDKYYKYYGDNSNRIAPILRHLLLEKDVKLNDVSLITGISVQMLSKYTRRLVVPPPSKLKKICDYFCIQLDDFFKIETPFDNYEYQKGDQKAKADAGKLRLTLVPRKVIYAIAKVREYGNAKYGDTENWRNVEPERYRDAMMRHMMAYLDDPTGVDEESGLPHLWHLACNVAFLCEIE